MKSLTEVNVKLTELHNALDQVIGFLGKTQGEIVSLKTAVGGILGEAQTVRVVRKRKASVYIVPDGPDGAAQSASTTETPQAEPQATAMRNGKRGWPKGLKRGARSSHSAEGRTDEHREQEAIV